MARTEKTPEYTSPTATTMALADEEIVVLERGLSGGGYNRKSRYPVSVATSINVCGLYVVEV
jgi:hypothetical protein